jgi:ribosomal protein L32
MDLPEGAKDWYKEHPYPERRVKLPIKLKGPWIVERYQEGDHRADKWNFIYPFDKPHNIDEYTEDMKRIENFLGIEHMIYCYNCGHLISYDHDCFDHGFTSQIGKGGSCGTGGGNCQCGCRYARSSRASYRVKRTIRKWRLKLPISQMTKYHRRGASANIRALNKWNPYDIYSKEALRWEEGWDSIRYLANEIKGIRIKSLMKDVWGI